MKPKFIIHSSRQRAASTPWQSVAGGPNRSRCTFAPSCAADRLFRASTNTRHKQCQKHVRRRERREVKSSSSMARSIRLFVTLSRVLKSWASVERHFSKFEHRIYAGRAVDDPVELLPLGWAMTGGLRSTEKPDHPDEFRATPTAVSRWLLAAGPVATNCVVLAGQTQRPSTHPPWSVWRFMFD